VKVTRKVFNTWRNVCGKKTKDLFKRWKTLPEHQSEGDEFCDQQQTQSHPTTPGRTTPTTPAFGESSSNAFQNFNSVQTPPMSTVGKIKKLVKKHSQVEMPEDTQKAAPTGWSVHVWG
jgi:hypothetical protein